ncbi:DUF2949 domain-containing protein [Altericista sp. CCNU0014]|uniref:DUF2949 domain-containing protein n=1 Tax=Altericista sp. CCNU0014 TaxID=3082949 RepID=UPI00384D2132
MNNQYLIQYLQHDLGLSDAAIASVTRNQQPSVTELPIVLWNYGLISLKQLEHIFDWIEKTAP